MKKTLSYIAASAILGSTVLFTGCSLNDDDNAIISGTTASTFTGQASVVSQLNTGALTLTFTDTNGTCFNNKTLSTTGETIKFTSSDFNASSTAACSENLKSDYSFTVNTALASYDYNTSNKLADKVGANFKGKKGKKVNIFSTIAIATGQDVEDIDANDVKNPVIKALKELFQAKIAAGTLDIDTLSIADLNISAIASAQKAGTVEVTNTAVAAAITKLGVSPAAVTALATALENNASATLSSLVADGTITDANLTAIDSNATAAAAAPKMVVSNIAMQIGDNVWSAADNNFTVTKKATQEVNASQDVVIAINAAGLNDFTVTDGTLKAVIETTAGNMLTATLTGVSISTETNGTSLSATVAAGSTLSIASTYAEIGNASATLSKDVTTTDLTFSVNTLIDALSANEAAVTATKNDIIDALDINKTYSVTVGISGVATTAITNLKDVSADLGTGFKGFKGTVIVGDGTTTAGDDQNTTGGDDQNTSGEATELTLTSITTAENAFTALAFPTNPPAVPELDYLVSGMSITSSSTGTATISFTNAGSAVEEYKVYYASSTDTSLSSSDTVTSGDIEITGLTSGTVYQIYVRSYWNAGDDSYKHWNYVYAFTAQ